ncbi:MAG: nucleotidyltransferase domain-containing protein [Flavobacteriales bacterium]|nr:nucleotidyltransferase domain-containing protein [Flavobacteriales bacterium]
MGTTTLTETQQLTSAQQAAVRTLLYFDVFHYPLRPEEIERFLDLPASQTADLAEDLSRLVEDGIIREHAGFFGFGDLAMAVERRKADNARAEKRMDKARRMSRFIGRFPFVRGVMLSGSMSKGCLAEDGDIDYFVITEPGRLWIARTLLISFKKFFLLNSRKEFCVNYFVDLDHLVIEDQNLFTATEIQTLIPTFDAGVCERFFLANMWAGRVLPNTGRRRMTDLPAGTGFGKRLLERLFRNGLGDEFDEWCMLRTLRHWRGKFAELDHKQFELALRTRKYVSKHHPRNFQQRVLDAHRARLDRFAQTHGLMLR